MIVIFRNQTSSSIGSTFISICEKYMLYGCERRQTRAALRDILVRHQLIEPNQQIDISAWSSEWSMHDPNKRFITRFIIYNDIAKKIGDIIIPSFKYLKVEPKAKIKPLTYTTNNLNPTTTTTAPYIIRFT